MSAQNSPYQSPREHDPEDGSPSHDNHINNTNNTSPSPNSSNTTEKLFIGNLSLDVRRNELMDLFKNLGDVLSIDLKSGFAFVELNGDIRAAIKELDQLEFQNRRIRVEVAKSAAKEQRQRESRDANKNKPSKCLFVANFGPRVTERTLDEIFAPFGKIIRISFSSDRKTFAFVEYDKVEDAEAALNKLHKSSFQERELTVEFSQRDEAPRRRSPPPASYRDSYDRYDRRRSRTPPRGRYDDRRRARSRSFERRPPRGDGYRRDYGRPRY